MGVECEKVNLLIKRFVDILEQFYWYHCPITAVYSSCNIYKSDV